MGNGPPFSQNGRMRITRPFPFGTTCRVHSGSGDLAAHWPYRGRGRGQGRVPPVPGPVPSFFACADAPGWPSRRRAACVCACARILCACVAQVAIAHVHVASKLALPFTLYSCPFGLLAAPAPGHVGSGRGRAPGAAPGARLHSPQLLNRGRRHLRIALENMWVYVPLIAYIALSFD